MASLRPAFLACALGACGGLSLNGSTASADDVFQLANEQAVAHETPVAKYWDALTYTSYDADSRVPATPVYVHSDSSMKLTGDWLGLRTNLEEVGWRFNLFNTNFYQGVTAGGQEEEWAYGGKLDYLINIDGGKSGLWQGLFVDFHAETRYGDDVNGIDGMLAPSNIAMAFPEEGVNITSITALKFTQAVSESVAFYAGKINTLQEYPLKYSPGMEGNLPGLAGFMNTSLVFNPIVARTIPYSAAGVGGAFMVGGAPIFTLTAFDPRERATEGMDDLYAEGVVIVPDFVFRTNFLGFPGAYNFGGSYANADYRSVDPAAYLSVPPEVILAGGPIEGQSWSLYHNFYQSVWVDDCDPTRSWGFFGQFGISDGNPNPISFVANGGIGGRAMFPYRPLDTFGVGFFYLGLSNNFKTLAEPILAQQDERGIEAFYNWAVTPWCRLTYDLQVADPSTTIYDTTILNGLRLQLIF